MINPPFLTIRNFEYIKAKSATTTARLPPRLPLVEGVGVQSRSKNKKLNPESDIVQHVKAKD